jgi:hypothetical protein
MKSFARINLLVIFTLSLILLYQTAYTQMYNLTGAWKDDGGTTYCVKHMGSELFWYVDGRPRVHNVFYGMIAGNTITGKWADLPGGRLQGNGMVSLRIESNNRFSKISQTGTYGGSVWTKVNDAECAQTAQAERWNVKGAGCWTAVWTRRGNSNTFDGLWMGPQGERVITVLGITISGRNVTANRTSSSDGSLCQYTGQLTTDGVAVSGSARCDNGSPWKWSATIVK